jgi:hypothetical protein
MGKACSIYGEKRNGHNNIWSSNLMEISCGGPTNRQVENIETDVKDI